ncbi:uncharacterized protein BJ212DRAFT_1013069 [Suillus subaureus]|uniref:Uncharacterized protein n=1 Tax=Suillus subaureus TaxID=48587 RepID=A0A9P7EGA7_9AGAM|nr:uncharacterized protein BJ212DRAFT_1013069 [Suillus subaureus]KAG1820261.1 hypothetical protein BJ212DRAFT_1013069 [Suillus subaureus]
MTQYAFPSSHSPYSTHQPIVYAPSSHSQHGHGGYNNYGTPLRRASTGHAHTSSPQYGYPTVVQAPQTAQYLSVPGSHHRSSSHSGHSHSRPRANSHSHHGHGHGQGQGHGYGYSTAASYPVTYATSAPLYVDIIALIRRHTDTVRTRALPMLIQAMVITTEVERPQSGTAFGSSLEWRSRKHSGYVDEHGREVDSRGRRIHRF